MSFHKVMQTLYKADAMNEWGSIVALTYMAAQEYVVLDGIECLALPTKFGQSLTDYNKCW